jgi:hypothetical protein
LLWEDGEYCEDRRQPYRARVRWVDPVTKRRKSRPEFYGDAVMPLAVRGLEAKTLDPYLAGWRKRVVPALGHLPVRIDHQRCR